jgi:hypothetical protein
VIVQVEEQTEEDDKRLRSHFFTNHLEFTQTQDDDSIITWLPSQKPPEQESDEIADKTTVNPPETAPDSAKHDTDDPAPGTAEHDEPEPENAAVLDGLKAYLDALEETLH